MEAVNKINCSMCAHSAKPTPCYTVENIECDMLTLDDRLNRDRLDEPAELMVDAVCSNREMLHYPIIDKK